MKHRIKLKRKDTGETLTIWSVFDDSGNRVKMQVLQNGEDVPVDIEVLEHERLFDKTSQEEAAKKLKGILHSYEMKCIINSADKIIKDIIKKLEENKSDTKVCRLEQEAQKTQVEIFAEEKLRTYIRKMGISHGHIGRECGISENRIYSIFKKDKPRSMKVDEFLKICEFINVNPLDFWNSEPSESMKTS